MKIFCKVLFTTFLLVLQSKVFPLEKKIKIIVEETPIRSFFEEASEQKTPKKEAPDKPPETPQEKNSENIITKKLVGSDIEIATKIFTKLNIPFEIEVVHWREMLPKIIAGEADMALGIEKNSKYDPHVIYPRTPTYTKNYSFYARANQLQDTYTMTFTDALAGNYRVGIIIGFSYPKVFWEAYPFENKQLNSHLKEGKNLRDNLIKLKEKKLDLVIADRERTDILLKKMGAEEAILKYKNILFWKEFYLVFLKKSQNSKISELKSKIERELYKMTESEQIKEINDFWVTKGMQ